jgi:hypothetical protein
LKTLLKENGQTKTNSQNHHKFKKKPTKPSNPLRNKIHVAKFSPRKKEATINYDIFTEIFKEENFRLNVFHLQKKRSNAARQSYNTIEGENENENACCCKLEVFISEGF